ncbi:MAG: alginate lyase family protein [Kiritimatiellae bacterium]|nr:alginate lyase family protein [Kiritimatiellia bacterium]MDD5523118.1 alginate lyase family protein [Kiritimatiellia bacterium]
MISTRVKKAISCKLICLCVCTILHAAESIPTAETGPGLTDAQFFAMLDLDRADLTAVKAAVTKSDWPAAKHAFAEHLRNRKIPSWTFDPKSVGRDPKRRITGTEKALKHQLRSIGIDWQFGETIDWKFNPTTQPDSKWPVNHEWTWQLSRHPMWIDLGRAFYATGNEKYAMEFVAQLKSWTRDCPVPVKKADNKAFSRWRTIEAGIRAGSVWPEVYHLFLASKSFDDDALILMMKSFAEHAIYLMQFFTKGNWLAMESNGLYHVGALFPEFKDAKTWRDTAIDRIYREMDIQVYPDGAQIELAPGYHGVTVHNFLGPVNLVPLTGFELPKDYVTKMEKMFDYFLFSMQPTRKTPALNDSGAGAVTRWMETGAKLFPHREDFLWVATDGKQGKAPVQISYRFPYAGQFFMRSGWDRNAVWLCMEGGPFGFGHQHEDKLGVTLTAFGKSLLVEGGVYTYDASDWRRYVLSSRAHNVVMVDGFDQNRRKSPRETFVVKDPLPHVWESNATFDHVMAVYEEGWGPKAERIVEHTRHVLFIKPDLFAIVDELEPKDDKAHTYEMLFHLDASDVKVDGLRVTTQDKGANLTILAFGADGVGIVKGQKEPVVQGWLPDSSSGYGGVRPIPTAIYRKQAQGKTTMRYALFPSTTSVPCPVKDLQYAGSTFKIRYMDGSEKNFTLK